MGGIYTNRPKPYCDSPMLAALKALAEGKPVKKNTGTAIVLEALRSRGWIDRKTGQITERGRDYLKRKESAQN